MALRLMSFIILTFLVFTRPAISEAPDICERWLADNEIPIFHWDKMEGIQHSSPYKNKVTTIEREALEEYQEFGYTEINNSLRGSEAMTPAIKEYITHIDSIFKKASPIPEGLVLYRSEYLSPDRALLQVGETGRIDAYVSTSSKELGPMSYGSGEAVKLHEGDSVPIVLGQKIIIRGDSIKGIHMDSIVPSGNRPIDFSQENEILLKHGLKYNVVEIKEVPALFGLSETTRGGVRRFKYVEQTIEVWNP